FLKAMMIPPGFLALSSEKGGSNLPGIRAWRERKSCVSPFICPRFRVVVEPSSTLQRKLSVGKVSDNAIV
ncbi:MAG: hypothetical protein KDJ53_07115, partial [Rhodobiaceae bacterium]|nr:hypothetical protein [Rhodobiaceae bacterium]